MTLQLDCKLSASGRVSVILYAILLQEPEHYHIEFVRNLAGFTNNKNAFLTIMRWHRHDGHTQYQTF